MTRSPFFEHRNIKTQSINLYRNKFFFGHFTPPIRLDHTDRSALCKIVSEGPKKRVNGVDIGCDPGGRVPRESRFSNTRDFTKYGDEADTSWWPLAQPSATRLFPRRGMHHVWWSSGSLGFHWLVDWGVLMYCFKFRSRISVFLSIFLFW